jgi:hypothetical protein
VKRGDLEPLISKRPPGVMAIVDGQFHQCLSVGHAEIRSAIAAGWQVWGLSSMGAIRAYEMRHMGVRGYGRVYECFSRHVDFRDDEVALVHDPEPPYVPLSEPLVHIRIWVQELVKTGRLSAREKKHLLDRLMSMWFGERTLSRVRSMLLEMIPEHQKDIDAMLASFDRFRIKCHDLSNFLREQPWKSLS